MYTGQTDFDVTMGRLQNYSYLQKFIVRLATLQAV